jgi:hypothetical protein
MYDTKDSITTKLKFGTSDYEQVVPIQEVSLKTVIGRD